MPPDRNRDGSKGRGSKGRKTKSKPKTKTRDAKPPASPAGIRPGGLKKLPSNAPTMAIAPSDYEHIFHEGPVAPGANAATIQPVAHGPQQQQQQQQQQPQHVQHQPPLPVPVMPALPPIPLGQLGATGPKPTGFALGNATKPHFAAGRSPQSYGRPVHEQQAASPAARPHEVPPKSPPPPTPIPALDGPLQVTADGYTLIGQTPDDSIPPVALPPHIVRSSNQFSRAALTRIAAYLASRAERS